ncbi:MAG TPA: pilus assembly protein TadG-related protein [Caulobacteraceae bacterium]
MPKLTAVIGRRLSAWIGAEDAPASPRSALHYLASSRGNLAVMTALLMLPFAGALSLAGDVASALMINRSLQNAADSSAIAAATGDDTATDRGSPAVAVYQREALAVAAKYGFVNGANNVTVTATTVTNAVNPKCPAAATQCFQVTVAKVVPLYFAAVVGYKGNATINGAPAWKVSATAVAAPYAGAQNVCVLALDPTSTQSATADVTGGNTVLNKCSLWDNSADGAAFTLTGGTFTAQAAYVVGGFTNTGPTGDLTLTSPTSVQTQQNAAADPYAGLYAANSVSNLVNQSCPSANKGVNINTSQTIQPGVYCNTLNISNGNVVLASGTYIIQGGKFSVSGGSVSGTNVTIILTCDTPPCSSSSHYATATLTGGTSNLSAPTNGTWAGMLFYQDPNDPTSNKDKSSLTGGGNTLEGALYFPTQQLTFTGGAASAPCTQIVAWTVTFTGGGTVGYSCVGAGVAVIGDAGAKLALVQ